MTSDLNGKKTEQFSVQELPQDSDSPIDYFRPVPHSDSVPEDGQAVAWRVRFTPATDPGLQFGLEINGDVVLGRYVGSQQPDDLIDLNSYGADTLGVSRRHLMIRPTATNLFIIDQNSTNGTFRNGRSIGSHTPYSLVDGDVITLGKR